MEKKNFRNYPAQVVFLGACGFYLVDIPKDPEERLALVLANVGSWASKPHGASASWGLSPVPPGTYRKEEALAAWKARKERIKEIFPDK
tara:strand:- start:1192 stop:1458 length:267 start_codon:yes stop_codon:yes gene_type:complete